MQERARGGVADKKIQGAGTVEQRAQLLDKEAAILPRAHQCRLLGVSRTGSYYKARPKRDEQALRESVKELYEKDPCLGWSKLSFLLGRDYGIKVGRTKIERIRKELGLRTIYRHPATSTPSRKREEGKYKYRLKELETIKVDDVWTSDITYLQMERRNYYLCCVMDWESREILGWSFSERMEVTLCLEALEMALESGRSPKIFNTDQGSQYTSREWTERLKRRDILISMDGKGRWADNIHMERFWRTLKYDCFLLHEPTSVEEAKRLISGWITYYNQTRPHASLGNLSPSEYSKRQGYPPAVNFLSHFSTTEKPAPLRGTPSLRSGSFSYVSKRLKKLIDLTPA